MRELADYFTPPTAPLDPGIVALVLAITFDTAPSLSLLVAMVSLLSNRLLRGSPVLPANHSSLAATHTAALCGTHRSGGVSSVELD